MLTLRASPLSSMAANNALDGHSDLLDVIVYELPEKGLQYRLAVTSFRDVLYLSMREWYMSYDNEFSPSSNGFTIPYTLTSVAGLYKSLSILLSKAEVDKEVSTEKETLESFKKQAAFVSYISKHLAIPLYDLNPEKIVSMEKTNDSITIKFGL